MPLIGNVVHPRKGGPNEGRWSQDAFLGMSLRQPRRIERVLGFAGSQALGDFICENVFYATIAQMAGADELTVIYKNDRPYKEYIVRCNAAATRGVGFPLNDAIPFDWLDIGAYAPHVAPHEWWYEQLCHVPDLILTPSMAFVPSLLSDSAALRIPPAEVDALSAALVARGVPREGWFVGLHVREANYRFRPVVDVGRASDPQAYLPAIRRIIASGGTVVRIGDPSMTPLPALPGLIDLTRDPDIFPLHAFAFSRARFNLTTDSGPTSLSCAFHVPALVTNCFTPAIAFHAHDIVVLRRIRMKNGSVMRPGTPEYADKFPDLDLRFLAHGQTDTYDGSEIDAIVDNSPEELVAATEDMLSATANVAAWREAEQVRPVAPQRPFTWPPAYHAPRARVWAR